MTFGPFGVRMLRLVFLSLVLLLEVLLLLCLSLKRFVEGVWEAMLLVARAPAGYIVLAKMMRLINTVLSSLTLLFLPCCSFVSVSNL